MGRHGKFTSEAFANMLFRDSIRSVFGEGGGEFHGNESIQEIYQLLLSDEMGARMVQGSMRTYLLSFMADSDSLPSLDPRVAKYAVVEVYPDETLNSLRSRFLQYLQLPPEQQETCVAGLLTN